jgi:molecular chaperone DnaJ
VRTTCPHCRGTGQSIPSPCNRCGGAGQVKVGKKVSVRIPAGVDGGSRLRLAGEGEPSPEGGPPGDLYVFIHVKAHDFFKREGTHVICQVPISFIQAALGDTIQVPTLNGERDLDIPKGTQPGEVFRLSGEGIASLKTGQRGDQLIQVDVRTPTGLNKKQESLLREFAKLESGKFKNKMKNMLKGNSASAAR